MSQWKNQLQIASDFSAVLRQIIYDKSYPHKYKDYMIQNNLLLYITVDYVIYTEIKVQMVHLPRDLHCLAVINCV